MPEYLQFLRGRNVTGLLLQGTLLSIKVGLILYLAGLLKQRCHFWRAFSGRSVEEPTNLFGDGAYLVIYFLILESANVFQRDDRTSRKASHWRPPSSVRPLGP